MWIDIGQSADLVVGSYRFTFGNIFDINRIPGINVPSSYAITHGGTTKRITITRSYADKATGKYILEFTLHENPEPITVITVATFVLLGLALGYMVLQKVEKLVESPSVSLGIAVVAGFGALALWKNVKKAA